MPQVASAELASTANDWLKRLGAVRDIPKRSIVFPRLGRFDRISHDRSSAQMDRDGIPGQPTAVNGSRVLPERQIRKPFPRRISRKERGFPLQVVACESSIGG